MALKQKNISARAVHLITLPWMNCLLLNSFYLQSIQLLVQYLTKIHNNTLMDLLPQMGTENLNQRYLQCRNLSMHKNSHQTSVHSSASYIS
ncbi:hypothetical protein N665_0190s0042 [Sinapis alba]|nr:hypothetical protein N665_0190s0042 [Sinapis alba]